MFNTISSLVIPLLVLFVVAYGIIKKVNIYDIFVEGSTESFDLVLTMFPCLLAMIFGVNIFLKSGVLDFIFQCLEPFFSYLKIPIEIFPMMIMRPISGSSSLAILNNIYEGFGPDSFIGRLASVIQGSTDTTFYILTLYFGSVGIRKIRYALWSGLFADLLGMVAALFLVNFLF